MISWNIQDDCIVLRLFEQLPNKHLKNRPTARKIRRNHRFGLEWFFFVSGASLQSIIKKKKTITGICDLISFNDVKTNINLLTGSVVIIPFSIVTRDPCFHFLIWAYDVTWWIGGNNWGDSYLGAISIVALQNSSRFQIRNITNTVTCLQQVKCIKLTFNAIL